MSALEDLIVENRKTFHTDLMVARAQPRDDAATSRLKSDEDQMAALAELAKAEPENIVDCAIRGANVTFQVKDAAGVVSSGFFPVAALAEPTSKRSRASGTVATHTPSDPSPTGGAATVPTVVTADDGTSEDEGDADKGDATTVPPTQGVPAGIDRMSASEVAELLKDTPEGVDPHAVLKHEFARDGGPRSVVTRAAAKTGLLDSTGQPQSSTTPIT
jgi:hypothetical protein